MSIRKTLVKEVELWKKRYQASRKTLTGVSKDIGKDVRKVYKEVTK